MLRLLYPASDVVYKSWPIYPELTVQEDVVRLLYGDIIVIEFVYRDGALYKPQYTFHIHT